VQVRLKKDKVSLQGASKKFDRPTDAGTFVHFYFCSTCGSNVYWEIDALPDSIIAPVPSFSFYEDCMLSWVQLPDSVTEHM
jgi:hypothetical protein